MNFEIQISIVRFLIDEGSKPRSEVNGGVRRFVPFIVNAYILESRRSMSIIMSATNSYTSLVQLKVLCGKQCLKLFVFITKEMAISSDF